MEKTMYDVVKARIDSKLTRGADKARMAVERMTQEGKQLNDYIIPVGEKLRDQGRMPVRFNHENGTVQMVIDQNGTFNLHPHAVSQMGEKLNIPPRYLRELATSGEYWARELAMNILNEHAAYSKKERHLVRTVGDQVRGFLGESYKRINSFDVVTAFLQEVMGQGAFLADGMYDDTKMFMEVLMPEPFMIETPKNGTVGIAFGARLANSDFGDGALDYRVFLIQGICLNGAVRESLMRSIHIGGKLGDDILLSKETHDKNTAAQISAIRDVTKIAFDRSKIEKTIHDIKTASSVDVDFNTELNKLFKDKLLLKEETEGVQKLLMANRMDDGLQGEATMWKLMQAVSAIARDAEPRRERELHEISGKILDMATYRAR